MSLKSLFEEVIVLVTVIGTAIYAFTLGYLDTLGVPSTPEFSQTVSFFIRAILAGTERVRPDVMLFVLFAVSTAAIISFSYAARSASLKRLTISSGLTACLASVSFLGHLTGWKSFLVMIAILVPTSAVAILIPILSKWKTTEAWGPTRLLVVVVVGMAFEIVPFRVGNYLDVHQASARPFPVGFSTKESSKQGEIIWMAGEITYWLYCSGTQPTIEGVSSDGEVSPVLPLSANRIEKLCK